jgi:phosphoenolpyruvate carboxykinase (GTP)
VLKWIFDRLEGRAEAVDTPIGLVPARGGLDISGLGLTDAQMDLLLSVDPAVWAEEAALIKPHYESFGDHLPQALWDEYEGLLKRLRTATRSPAMAAAE